MAADRKAYYATWAAANQERLRAYRRAYYERNTARLLAQQRARRQAHPEIRKSYRERTGEQTRAYMARWETEHRDERRAYHAKYEAEHRDERREKARPYQRRYNETHRDEKRANAREWARANSERNRARVRAWAKANPDMANTLKIRHRALVRGAAGTHSAEEWHEKVSLLGGVCLYCGAAGPLTRDHKLPLTRGGSNAITNIVPACGTCNASKGTRTAIEFSRARDAERSMLATRMPRTTA